MGNGPSFELDGVHLQPLSKPIVSINPRFVHDELLTFQCKSSGLSSSISFCNVHTDTAQFTVNQSTRSKRLTLLDGGGDIATAKCRPKTFEYDVHLGSEYDGDAAFVIHVHYNSEVNTKVRAKFTDRVTHEQYELGFEGFWRKRTAYFWLARSSDDNARKPVATVSCPDGVSRSKYHVSIAPHMDVALILMVCAMLDKEQQWRETFVPFLI